MNWGYWIYFWKIYLWHLDRNEVVGEVIEGQLGTGSSWEDDALMRVFAGYYQGAQSQSSRHPGQDAWKTIRPGRNARKWLVNECSPNKTKKVALEVWRLVRAMQAFFFRRLRTNFIVGLPLEVKGAKRARSSDVGGGTSSRRVRKLFGPAAATAATFAPVLLSKCVGV